eukprot:TRINITY_DN1323_c0_g1_i1.p1 TRINITY_DN1323_c0_g1~~TRINITY_DN1323_c0_g1_i1.p1  ORF type:complete len:400 (+),score=84.27 TRINITY_DN1323_c0_g1_i1:246-1445(+)
MVNARRRSLQKACACASHDDFKQAIKVVPSGEPGSLEYRVHLKTADGRPLSPWHSVPLYAGQGLLNFVCEIPRNSRAKFEVATTEAGNPIKQDSKKGKPRSYAIDILWNYGMLPQTWEDPSHASQDCDGCLGDNDPVDIVEIGDKTGETGGIYAVKPICALAMIDEGELDWKILAIAASDPRCDLVNDVADLEEHFPGTVSAVREWFRSYKTFDGKPMNKFALNEEAMDREYTLNTIAQTHALWKAMVGKARSKGGVFANMTVGEVPVPTHCFAASAEAAAAEEDTAGSAHPTIVKAEGKDSAMEGTLTTEASLVAGSVVEGSLEISLAGSVEETTESTRSLVEHLIESAGESLKADTESAAVSNISGVKRSQDEVEETKLEKDVAHDSKRVGLVAVGE